LGEITGRQLRAKNARADGKMRARAKNARADGKMSRFWRTEKESPCPAGKYSYGLTDTYT